MINSKNKNNVFLILLKKITPKTVIQEVYKLATGNRNTQGCCYGDTRNLRTGCTYLYEIFNLRVQQLSYHLWIRNKDWTRGRMN